MENPKYYDKLKEILQDPDRKNNLFNAVLSSSGNEVSVSQRSQEWLQWRKDGVTATEAVIIEKGEHFGKKIADLFDEKVDKKLPKNVSNQYTQRGVIFEESVLQFFSTHRNIEVKSSGGFQNKILPLLRCSLDSVSITGHRIQKSNVMLCLG